MFFYRRHRERQLQEVCSRPAADTCLCQGFASAFVTAQDGLTLHVRRYGSPALDYRGHGQSQYDRHSNNYTIRVALADLSAVLAALAITSAIFVGTSFGGVLAMMLAVLPPIAVAGVILNDIGPVMEPRGLMRIKSYVGKLP